MLFINNKYTNWYYSLINKAKQRSLLGYAEKHHIIPKSLGGLNTDDNLVKLTAREHFICHRLLIKMTTGHPRRKMLHALGKFVQSSPLQQRIITARQYEIARKAIVEARTGIKHSEESRRKISEINKNRIPWNKGRTGIVHSDQSNRRRSITQKNKPTKQCPHCNKIGKGNVMNRYHFDNCNSPRSFRPKFNETKQCPHCNKIGKGIVMNRHHFDNCKSIGKE
jgi:NUMOD3 motif